jgi:hypothetical protein
LVDVAQLLRPVADTLTTSWLTNAGASANLWATLDEEPPDDTDFATQQNGGNNNALEVRFAAPVSTPLIRRGHVVAYRYRKHLAAGNIRNMQVQLRQGATVIATGTLHTDIGVAWVPGAFTLTPAEAGAITDYADLRLRVMPTGATNGTTARRQAQISHAVLRLPEPLDIVDDLLTRWSITEDTSTPGVIKLTLSGVTGEGVRRVDALADLWDQLRDASPQDATRDRRWHLSYYLRKHIDYTDIRAQIVAGTYALPASQTQAVALGIVDEKLNSFVGIVQSSDAQESD